MATSKPAAKKPAAKPKANGAAAESLVQRKAKPKTTAGKIPAQATRPRARRAGKQNGDTKITAEQKKAQDLKNAEDARKSPELVDAEKRRKAEVEAQAKQELKTDTQNLKEDLGKTVDSTKQAANDVGSAIVEKAGQALQETKRLFTPGPDEVSLDSRTRRADDIKKSYHKGLFQGAVGMLAATAIGGMLGDMWARRRNRM